MEPRVSTYGLFRGRFQPFHLGHLEQCRTILDSHRILAVGIVVVKADVGEGDLSPLADASSRADLVQSFKGASNPFSYVQVYEMVLRSLLEDGIDGERILIVPHFSPFIYPERMEFLCSPPQSDTTLYIPEKGGHNVRGVSVYRERGWQVVALRPAKWMKDGEYHEYSGTAIRELFRQGQDIRPFVSSAVCDCLRRIEGPSAAHEGAANR